MPVKFDLPFTQTSHIIAFACTILVAVSLTSIVQLDSTNELINLVVKVIHLASLSGWWGTQLWVTFFAGITMYKILPRHTFGLVQSKLFPKYFQLGTMFTSFSVVTFAIENPYGEWKWQQTVQASILIVSLVTVLTNLLYFNPTTIAIMFEKHKFEKKINAGATPGKLEDDKLAILNEDPKYVSLSKKFVMLHTLASIANLLAFCAQGVLLIYIASEMKN